MASNDYHFVTRWCFSARIEEVSAVLQDIEGLATWWRSVYLDVRTLEAGDPVSGVGRRVDLLTKGRLPYTLRWQFIVIETNPPHGFCIQAQGDFVGRGEWSLQQNGDIAEVEFDWRIRAEKPILKLFSWALRPVFAWNHRWAMEQGQSCLCAELKRRRRAAEENQVVGVCV